MPFKSEKQRRYLYANKPEVAKKFASYADGGLIAYDPRTTDKYGPGSSKLPSWSEEFGVGTEGNKQMQQKMKELGYNAASFTPIIGDAIGAKELWDELQANPVNWGMVALLGGALLVGVVPGFGDAIAGAMRTAVKPLLRNTKRIAKVDPQIRQQAEAYAKAKETGLPVPTTCTLVSGGSAKKCYVMPDGWQARLSDDQSFGYQTGMATEAGEMMAGELTHQMQLHGVPKDIYADLQFLNTGLPEDISIEELNKLVKKDWVLANKISKNWVEMIGPENVSLYDVPVSREAEMLLEDAQDLPEGVTNFDARNRYQYGKSGVDELEWEIEQVGLDAFRKSFMTPAEQKLYDELDEFIDLYRLQKGGELTDHGIAWTTTPNEERLLNIGDTVNQSEMPGEYTIYKIRVPKDEIVGVLGSWDQNEAVVNPAWFRAHKGEAREVGVISEDLDDFEWFEPQPVRNYVNGGYVGYHAAGGRADYDGGNLADAVRSEQRAMAGGTTNLIDTSSRSSGSVPMPTSRPTRQEVVDYHGGSDSSAAQHYLERHGGLEHLKGDVAADTTNYVAGGANHTNINQTGNVARVYDVSDNQSNLIAGLNERYADLIAEHAPGYTHLGFDVEKHLRNNPNLPYGDNVGAAIQQFFTDTLLEGKATQKELSWVPDFIIDRVIPDDTKVFVVDYGNGRIEFTFGDDVKDAIRNLQNTGEIRDKYVSSQVHPVLNANDGGAVMDVEMMMVWLNSLEPISYVTESGIAIVQRILEDGEISKSEAPTFKRWWKLLTDVYGDPR